MKNTNGHTVCKGFQQRLRISLESDLLGRKPSDPNAQDGATPLPRNCYLYEHNNANCEQKSLRNSRNTTNRFFDSFRPILETQSTAIPNFWAWYNRSLKLTSL